MNKCALCTRPATVSVEVYDIVEAEFDAGTFYCDDHMFNVVTDGLSLVKVTKELIATEKLVLHGRHAYVRK